MPLLFFRAVVSGTGVRGARFPIQTQWLDVPSGLRECLVLGGRAFRRDHPFAPRNRPKAPVDGMAAAADERNSELLLPWKDGTPLRKCHSSFLQAGLRAGWTGMDGYNFKKDCKLKCKI